MLTSIIAIIGVASTSQTPNYDTANIFQMITSSGARYVCADLNDARSADEWQARQWILGFWSGLNIAYGVSGNSRPDVGQTSTPNGVIGEVKLQCHRTPSASIPDTVVSVYEKFRASGK